MLPRARATAPASSTTRWMARRASEAVDSVAEELLPAGGRRGALADEGRTPRLGAFSAGAIPLARSHSGDPRGGAAWGACCGPPGEAARLDGEPVLAGATEGLPAPGLGSASAGERGSTTHSTRRASRASPPGVGLDRAASQSTAPCAATDTANATWKRRSRPRRLIRGEYTHGTSSATDGWIASPDDGHPPAPATSPTPPCRRPGVAAGEEVRGA